MSTGVAQARRIFISDHPVPWLLPLVAILVVFAVYPFFYNIYLSFHEFVPRKRGLEFVGLDNWVKLFADPRMWNALWVTLFYTGICLAIELVLGMAIALLIDSDEPGFGILRGMLTLTLVIPPAITGMMFLLMEDAQFGLISWTLARSRPARAGHVDPGQFAAGDLGRGRRRRLAVDAVHGADLRRRVAGAAARPLRSPP